MTTRKPAEGGIISGEEFDDGVNDYVRKVIVGEDSNGVVYIKIEYVKDGLVVQREHGRNTGTQTETEFEVNYPDEYITLIRGRIGDDDLSFFGFQAVRDARPVVRDGDDPRSEFSVSEIQFETSYGRTSQVFGKPRFRSKEFVLEGKDGTKLVGLHGRASDFLCAIGAHFILVSSVFKQIKPLGGSEGVSWDDGVYDYVSKVRVGEDGDRVSSVEFDYKKGEQLITHCHGKKLQERKEFVLEYGNGEYIKSIEGFCDEDGFISSLTFKTSRDRDSEEFGKAVGTKFVVRAKGFDKLVGFRGRSSVDRINALGANFAVVLAPPVKKQVAKGGDVGDEWDDGIHDGVNKIIITSRGSMVKSVKFEYINGYENGWYQTVDGDNHEKIDKDDDKTEFKLWCGDEYITSVEGHYGRKLRLAGRSREMAERFGFEYITMLKFETNMGTYKVLGSATDDYEYVGTPFELGETDHKIVGFHGKSSYCLQQLGVYVKPIDNP